LHGLASNSRIWDLTAPFLLDRFRVVAMDQRGHGLSDKPGAYGFEEVTGDAFALYQHHDQGSPVVIGHSWGASVALQYAASYPDETAGVGLVDGGVFDMSARMTWEEAEVMMRPPEMDGIPADGFVRSAQTWPDLAPLWSDEVREMLLSNFEVRDGRIYRRLPIPDHMKIVRTLWESDTKALFGRIRCPVLIVPAMKDETDPRRSGWMQGKLEAVEAAAAALPDARVVVMEDTIHDIPVQRPRELAQAISDFAAALP
jgi:pimeloyl-ACP methyl ester carboxylesterase